MPDKPVPTGVGAAVKQGLLDLVGLRSQPGLARIQDLPGVLGPSQRRQRRWRRRQEGGEALDDGRPGALPDALMPSKACGGS